jgi:acetyltransferase-like isoleucine patch superfamily enzyme
MRSFVRLVLERVASFFKGKGYRLDGDLPLRPLFGLAYRRGICLARCVTRGIAFRPSKLVFVGADVELRNRTFIQLGKGVTLGRNVVIDGLSREGVEVGAGVSIGPYTVIEASGTITNLGKGIRIGAHSGIGGFSFIGGAGGVVIGENVIMGQWVSFHPENHNHDSLDLPIRLQGVNRKGIVVGDDCWIGAKVTFLDGAQVGKGCVIAAGAVVRGEIPPYSIAAGVPAKVIRSRKEGAGL